MALLFVNKSMFGIAFIKKNAISFAISSTFDSFGSLLTNLVNLKIDLSFSSCNLLMNQVLIALSFSCILEFSE